jgi:uncharacterized protein (TIGR03437 family)
MLPRLLLIALLALVPVAFSQALPGYQWVKQVDGSGLNSALAGVATDALGNVYLAGTTSSQHFPVKNALQAEMRSAGLYRFSGTAWTSLDLASCTSLALDPQNPAEIYAVSRGLKKSADGGVTFTSTTLADTQVFAVAIKPGNGQTIYAATAGQGVFRSADGGATWATANNGLPMQTDGSIRIENIWIDPANPGILFAATTRSLMRSTDGGASWQATAIGNSVERIAFDPGNAGVLYVHMAHDGLFRSADHGQTFAPFSVPKEIGQVLPDPMQPERLIGVGTGLFQSTDGGTNWTRESDAPIYDLVADPVNGVYYALSAGSGVVQISRDLKTVTSIEPRLSSANLNELTVANGQLYATSLGSTDVFVTKLDPSGNIVYSTYLGGSSYDQASALAVDAAGNVFVTGTTQSADFPASEGAYASSGSVFLTRLNADGSLGYSTYFSGTTPVGVATDGSGSAWLLGNSTGQLPVTPGALSTAFCCQPGYVSTGPPIIPQEASLTRFSPSGSSLSFSTYVSGSGTVSPLGTRAPATALALSSDGSAYIGGALGIFRVDAAGSTLLSSTNKALVIPQAMAFGPDGSLYAAGTPDLFEASPGAFQSAPSLAGIVRLDAALSKILAATAFGSTSQAKALATDADGHVYIGGSTGWNLPARTPLAGAFAGPTGFLSELSGDLSTLLFSSYFGDSNKFTVAGLSIGQNGDVLIGGTTNLTNSTPGQGDVWVNSLTLAPPPALRIDSVVNAASLADTPLAAGETIVVRGAGFGEHAQLLIGGTIVPPLSIAPAAITAIVPAELPAAAAVEVRSGGLSSNSLLMPVAVTSPGIFSQDGTGYGEGYILNKDGSLNSPSHPARPGDKITIFATGVGPMTFTDCCAVTDFPVNVFIDHVYCNGIAAIAGPVSGLPGTVYQISVYVPDGAALVANANRPPDGVVLQVNGANSQDGIAVSIER